MPKVLGLCGYPGVGKDEIAEFLVENHGFQRVSFADPLRESLYALSPWIDTDDSQVVRLQKLVDDIGWTAAKRNKEVRQLLQRMGTEAGRYIHGDDCWVKLAEKKFRKQPVVITDVRFSNEVTLVRKYHGFLLQIVRPGFGQINGHKSELMEYGKMADGTIANNGTIAELQSVIDDFVTEWLGVQQLSFQFSG